MDIAALSINLSMGRVQQSAGMALLEKALNASEVNIDALLKTMQQSVNPQVGANLDITV